MARRMMRGQARCSKGHTFNANQDKCPYCPDIPAIKLNYTGEDKEAVSLNDLNEHVTKKRRKRRTKKEITEANLIKEHAAKVEKIIPTIKETIIPEKEKESNDKFLGMKLADTFSGCKIIDSNQGDLINHLDNVLAIKLNESEKWWIENGGDSWYNKVAERDKISEVHAQHKANLHLIEKAVKLMVAFKFNNPRILEVGCGYGRVLRFLQMIMPDKVKQLYGVDLSLKMINKAIDLDVLISSQLKVCNARNVHTAFDKPFDIVLTNTVLMHVPPENIGEVIDSLLKTSCSHIVNVELAQADTYGPVPNASGGCWRHDLVELYRERGKYVRIIPQDGIDQMAYIIDVNTDIKETKV